MLGAIIGDIVGSRFEFNNTSNYGFELFTKESSFTDDTICTVAVADAILSGKSYLNSLLEWCRKYPHPMGGYGGSFSRWISSNNPQPYNSFGNGSAMRVSPVAYAFDSLKEIKNNAALTAEISHNHPEGIKGAVSVAHAIYILRNTHNLKKFRSEMLKYYPGFTTLKPNGVFDETCQGTVPCCFKIILNSCTFENAIRNAICWRGDSDTIGAIVGSMAEAMWGIPDEISYKALNMLPDEMASIIIKFYDLFITKKHE